MLFFFAGLLLILGLRIEVPEEPLPLAPELREESQAEEPPAPRWPAPAVEETPPAEPRKIGGVLAFLRLPIAAAAALAAQWVSDARPLPIDASQHLGWELYAVAFLFLAWAHPGGRRGVCFGIQGRDRTAADIRLPTVCLFPVRVGFWSAGIPRILRRDVPACSRWWCS